MALSKEEITSVFFERFSKEFIAELLRAIADQCRKSTEECFNFYPKEEGFDLLGGVRRAKVESTVSILVEDFAEITAEPKSSRKSGKGNYHRQIKCGNNAILTIHKVPTSKSKVRAAIHRDSYAQRAHYSLFENDAPPPPAAILYAQLKYGVDRKMPQALAFAIIDFPDKDGNIVHSISLLEMEEFANIPYEFVDLSTTENIEDNLNLNLRSDAKNKKKKEE